MLSSRDDSRRLLHRVVAVAVAAFAIWSLFAAGSGIVWMIRERRYVNDVMIAAVTLALTLAWLLARWATRQWRRSSDA